MARLIVFAGLAGSGKSTLARALAEDLGAVWLRVDSVEQAIRESDALSGSVGDSGYRALYAVARDNLRAGNDVISDSVNPWILTRDVWRDIGVACGAVVLEVETVCSDVLEHRRRVESRPNEIPALVLPDWQTVIARDYQPWDREHLIVDTAERSVDSCVELILNALQSAENKRYRSR